VPVNSYVNKFNRGEVDPAIQARDDFTKFENSAALMTNWTPQRLGPMQYRAGSQYLGVTAGATYMVPFVRSIDSTALLEFSNNLLRLWVDDALLARTTVATTIANGTFDSDVASWVDGDTGSGAASTWFTGGYMVLFGTGSGVARRSQALGSTATGEEHALRIVIREAAVVVKLGTSGANSEDLYVGELGPGTHSLVFTPGGSVTVTLENSKEVRAVVDSVALETTGTFSLPTTIATADLPNVRYAQSGDIIFIAVDGQPPIKIERRGVKSWSVTSFNLVDGPFGPLNTGPITLAAGALSGGYITLTASAAYFKATDVGALFKLVSAGQIVTDTTTTENDGTGSVRVVGVGTSRNVQVSATGFGTATVTLQQSTDDATWVDVKTYTSTASETYNDTLDNSILYYRLFIKTGDYSSGTYLLRLTYAGGAIEGVGRVAAYTSTTVVRVNALEAFGSTDATLNWYRDEWYKDAKYPSATAMAEGRLWFAGKGKFYGSVSDSFFSFDTELEGDSAAIAKTIAAGPTETIHWLMPLSRLIIGMVDDEMSIRSNSFGVVLTPLNTNVKGGSSQGAAPIEPVVARNRGYFVQRSGNRLYELEYSPGQDSHESIDMMTLNPTIGNPGIVRIAITMQPDARIHLVMTDGTMRSVLFNRIDDVLAWTRTETDGDIEDLVVLPEAGQDALYMVVSRTAGRFLEKFAPDDEAIGGTESRHTDAHVRYTSPGTSISGLAHLEGKTVHVWADGQYRSSHTVSSGAITVASSWTKVVVGLRHIASYNSSKVAGYILSPTGVKTPTALTRRKQILNVAFVLKDYWPGSLTVGRDASNLLSFPSLENGAAASTTTQLEYDEEQFPFNGEMVSDPRIYLRADNPCTVMAMAYEVEEAIDIASN
jgi:hypothetical protein